MADSSVQGPTDRHSPDKSWGNEEWIVNNHLYCGKRLYFYESGGHTSLHFHVNKHETMYIERGCFTVTTVDPTTAIRTDHLLMTGDSIVIEPVTVHRITAVMADSIMIEFSTFHEDSDSYRVEL